MKSLKLFIAAIAIALAFTCTAKAEIAPEKLKEINRMLELTGVEKMMEQMMEQMTQTIGASTPNLPPNFAKKFAEKAKANSFVNKIIPLYDKYYSVEDLRAINEFYSSPVGKKVTATMPQLLQESMKLGKAWGEDLAMETYMEIMKENREQPEAKK